jgi:hypothetical protein
MTQIRTSFPPDISSDMGLDMWLVGENESVGESTSSLYSHFGKPRRGAGGQ